MKKAVLFFMLIALTLSGCRKKAIQEIPEHTKGHVKLELNGQVIFDKDLEDVNYVSARKFAGFNYSLQDGTTRLGGGVTQVPAVGGTNAVETNPLGQTDPSRSLVELGSDTQEFQTPDGLPIRVIVGNGGQVRRPDKEHVVVEGSCLVTQDGQNFVSYQMKLVMKIANFH
jgi:hypothetical protein